MRTCGTHVNPERAGSPAHLATVVRTPAARSSRSSEPSGVGGSRVALVVLAIAASVSLQTVPQRTPAAASAIAARPTRFLYDDVFLKHLSGSRGHPNGLSA